MLHHAHEEHQRPFTANDLDSALEQAARFEQAAHFEQAKREHRREHCRSLTDSELCAELAQAKEAMRDRLQDAGSYLAARERRNAAIAVMAERGIRDRSASLYGPGSSLA